MKSTVLLLILATFCQESLQSVVLGFEGETLETWPEVLPPEAYEDFIPVDSTLTVDHRVRRSVPGSSYDYSPKKRLPLTSFKKVSKNYREYDEGRDKSIATRHRFDQKINRLHNKELDRNYHEKNLKKGSELKSDKQVLQDDVIRVHVKLEKDRDPQYQKPVVKPYRRPVVPKTKMAPKKTKMAYGNYMKTRFRFPKTKMAPKKTKMAYGNYIRTGSRFPKTKMAPRKTKMAYGNYIRTGSRFPKTKMAPRKTKMAYGNYMRTGSRFPKTKKASQSKSDMEFDDFPKMKTSSLDNLDF